MRSLRVAAAHRLFARRGSFGFDALLSGVIIFAPSQHGHRLGLSFGWDFFVSCIATNLLVGRWVIRTAACSPVDMLADRRPGTVVSSADPCHGSNVDILLLRQPSQPSAPLVWCRPCRSRCGHALHTVDAAFSNLSLA